MISIFIITWIENVQINWSFVNNKSITEIINKKLVTKLSQLKITHDENLLMILIIDHRATLKNYVWVSINCREVKARMKIYVCSIIVYHLLLELRWQKRVQMKIDMRKKILSIRDTDKRKRKIESKLTSIKVFKQMSIMKLKNDFDEEKVLQAIINEEIKKKKLKERRWRIKRFVSAEMRAQQT